MLPILHICFAVHTWSAFFRLYCKIINITEHNILKTKSRNPDREFEFKERHYEKTIIFIIQPIKDFIWPGWVISIFYSVLSKPLVVYKNNGKVISEYAVLFLANDRKSKWIQMNSKNDSKNICVKMSYFIIL